ncbi:HAD-IA family hydrolase [Candidatus Berkiella aquae]|uniref:HAD-IA family hydrolase n=1 Tax=Candidatus Berkiella aquae TaxID=295108 RepID=A0A0Q9YP74_9GAMM|nr:HAD-IA family hydrolase [Candidatus Berkiella aquae]MCS5712028.1 HAD-IA family hydrolase [Candidatus Berkiella aquae]
MGAPIEAILFDLDGTLLDTAPEFTHCLNVLLAQEGLPSVIESHVRSTVSYGAKGMIEFGFNITEHDPRFTDLKNRFLALYAKEIGFQTHFFPGIVKLLARLQTLCLPWGIVTNKPACFTFALLEKFSPLAKAGCVIAGDTLSTQKPDPAPLLLACQQLAVSPKNCWYIGDAKTDQEASHSAGMRCAIANYGYIPPSENALNWHADHYLAHASEIEMLLGPVL